MKKIFTLVIILTINIGFSQKNISGEIIYKKNIKFPAPKKKTPYYEKELKSILSSLEKLTYTLKFNNTISSFGLKKSMDLDIESFHRRAFSGKGKNVFYTDLKSNTCLEMKKLGGESFIVTNVKPKFILTNETRNISGFTCYKATTSETVYFSKMDIGMEDVVNEVVAWYTNKIPSQFGPLNFFGLPGLVLELQFSNVTYTATDLKLSNKSINITKPTKGKKMTLGEYEELMIETAKKMDIKFN